MSLICIHILLQLQHQSPLEVMTKFGSSILFIFTIYYYNIYYCYFSSSYCIIIIIIMYVRIGYVLKINIFVDLDPTKKPSKAPTARPSPRTYGGCISTF